MLKEFLDGLVDLAKQAQTPHKITTDGKRTEYAYRGERWTVPEPPPLRLVQLDTLASLAEFVTVTATGAPTDAGPGEVWVDFGPSPNLAARVPEIVYTWDFPRWQNAAALVPQITPAVADWWELHPGRPCLYTARELADIMRHVWRLPEEAVAPFETVNWKTIQGLDEERTATGDRLGKSINAQVSGPRAFPETIHFEAQLFEGRPWLSHSFTFDVRPLPTDAKFALYVPPGTFAAALAQEADFAADWLRGNNIPDDVPIYRGAPAPIKP